MASQSSSRARSYIHYIEKVKNNRVGVPHNLPNSVRMGTASCTQDCYPALFSRLIANAVRREERPPYFTKFYQWRSPLRGPPSVGWAPSRPVPRLRRNTHWKACFTTSTGTLQCAFSFPLQTTTQPVVGEQIMNLLGNEKPSAPAIANWCTGLRESPLMPYWAKLSLQHSMV
jgi:hypothetical protein